MKLQFNQKNIPLVATVVVFLLIYIAGSLIYRGFFSLEVFINLFIDNAFVGIIAVGMTFVIISGGIDLSVGSMVGFTCVFSATLVEQYHIHPLLVILLALLAGSLLGFTMGSLIHFFNLPPFLVTLVGMFLARGLAYIVNLSSIPIYNTFLSNLADFGIPLGGGIKLPAVALIFIAMLFVGIYLLHFTRFGRNTYAIGGNEKSAVLMGLPVARTKILIYTFSGFCSALGGVVYALYTLSGYSGAGVLLELDVIAAVVIGGTLLTGGVGFVEGTLVGILILGLIQMITIFQGNLLSWWTKIVNGFLVFIFILLQTYISRTRVTRKIDKPL